MIKNTSSSTITVSIPGFFKSDTYSLSLDADKYLEISIWIINNIGFVSYKYF